MLTAVFYSQIHIDGDMRAGTRYEGRDNIGISNSTAKMRVPASPLTHCNLTCSAPNCLALEMAYSPSPPPWSLTVNKSTLTSLFSLLTSIQWQMLSFPVPKYFSISLSLHWRHSHFMPPLLQWPVLLIVLFLPSVSFPTQQLDKVF